MSSDVEHATLQCSGCGQATDHRLIYAGRILTHTECSRCGHVVHPQNQSDLPREYVQDLMQRLRTKPRRLARRVSTHPLKFMRALPRAILRQPIKLITEYRTVRREEKDKGDR
jgi:enoyl-CoA hydratase/carnithine racemase